MSHILLLVSGATSILRRCVYDALDRVVILCIPTFQYDFASNRKIKNDKAEGIVVAPYWPSQPWYPLCSEMLLRSPIYFSPDNNLLLSPNRYVPHPLASKLWMMAGILSMRLRK